MSYAVKEIFYTLQGEGAHAGRPAVFCRFAGCNLWSGREADRAERHLHLLRHRLRRAPTDRAAGGSRRPPTWPPPWPRRGRAPASGTPYVVCTGGEPLLQLDDAAVEALHAAGFEVAVETNGTQPAPAGLDWICVSPKAGAPLRAHVGERAEAGVSPARARPRSEFAGLDFRHRFLQPMDGPGLRENTAAAAAYCLAHPAWRLSLQTHKLIGLP